MPRSRLVPAADRLHHTSLDRRSGRSTALGYSINLAFQCKNLVIVLAKQNTKVHHLSNSPTRGPKLFVPGSPSPFRPRKPPIVATIRIASRSEGGWAGGTGLRVMEGTNAFHCAPSQQ